MLDIFSQKLDAFGLDISDLSLKMAKLEKKRGEIKLASFGSISLPLSVVKKGEIKNKKILAEKIKKLLKDSEGEKLETSKVICSLPEERSFLDVIQFPKIKDKEIKQAVEYEIENHIPLPIEQVYFDFQIMKSALNNPKFTEVLIAASPKIIVDSYIDTLKMANLEPQILEIECQSIARALIKKGETINSILLIDFGENRTTFVIFSNRNIRFTSTIPISSKKLTQSISKNLKISTKKAEQLKIEYGLEEKKEIFEAMLPTLTDLSEQIKTHLKYWKSHEEKGEALHNNRAVEKILICGGGARLDGITDFLADQLKIPVELGNPWVNILKTPIKKAPALHFEQSLGYTTALGLALRGTRRI